jgi:fucose 4-O-acetylase-like acetyltransferase
MIRCSNWDTWKGVAILAVIALHVSNSTGTFVTGSYNYQAGIFWRQFLDFPVALFFAFAGFFSPNLKGKNLRETIKWLQTRIMRLCVPYFFWTFVYLYLRSSESLFNAKALIKSLVFGTGVGIGYFIVVLCCLTVLHPWISPVKKGWKPWVYAWASSLVTLVIEYYIRLRYPNSMAAAFPYTALPFTLWIGFYWSGYLLKKDTLYDDRPTLTRRFAVGLILIGLALSFIEAYILTSLGATFAGSQIRLSSFFYAFTIILAVFHSPIGNYSNPSLAWFGERSMTIYLSHLLLIPIADRLLKKIVPMLWQVQILYIPLATAVVAFLFVIIYSGLNSAERSKSHKGV